MALVIEHTGVQAVERKFNKKSALCPGLSQDSAVSQWNPGAELNGKRSLAFAWSRAALLCIAGESSWLLLERRSGQLQRYSRA